MVKQVQEMMGEIAKGQAEYEVIVEENERLLSGSTRVTIIGEDTGEVGCEFLLARYSAGG